MTSSLHVTTSSRPLWRARPKAKLSSSPSSRPAALAGGIAVLGSVFINRVLFTPSDSLPPPQSREDLLAVAAAAALTLYGLGRADVSEREQGPVELDGVDVRVGFENSSRGLLASRVDWTSRAVFSGIPAVKSFAFVVDGQELFRAGRFRDATCKSFVPEGGIADGVVRSGERAYLADLKVVPVRDTEFTFFPEKCQVRICLKAPFTGWSSRRYKHSMICSYILTLFLHLSIIGLVRSWGATFLLLLRAVKSIVIVPAGTNGVVILGADRPRPLTGSDFGWLQAVSDRLGDDLLATQ